MKDSIFFSYLEQEQLRQKAGLELIASENYVSDEVLLAQGSLLTNKYAEGYPHRRYYHGCEHIDQIEDLAITRALELFQAQDYGVNVQAHSGTTANLAVYFSCLKPGDKILAMGLKEGGHLSHGSSLSIASSVFPTSFYTLNPQNHFLDYDAIREQALKERPRLIIAGASAYPRVIDFKKFASIAQEIGAFLLADIAHVAGLIAKKLHPSPFGLADFITSTTHKTLRGPRGGLIFFKKDFEKNLQRSVFPGLQGGPLMHAIGAKAVAFYEALQPSFQVYQEQVLKNAQALSQQLKDLGVHLITEGTDNHLMLVDVKKTYDLTGKEAADLLHQSHITCNQNSIPFDSLSALITSGIRLGTPALTTRGLKENHMQQIGFWIHEVLLHKKSLATEVKEFSLGFPLYV